MQCFPPFRLLISGITNKNNILQTQTMFLTPYSFEPNHKYTETIFLRIDKTSTVHYYHLWMYLVIGPISVCVLFRSHVRHCFTYIINSDDSQLNNSTMTTCVWYLLLAVSFSDTFQPASFTSYKAAYHDGWVICVMLLL